MYSNVVNKLTIPIELKIKALSRTSLSKRRITINIFQNFRTIRANEKNHFHTSLNLSNPL